MRSLNLAHERRGPRIWRRRGRPAEQGNNVARGPSTPNDCESLHHIICLVIDGRFLTAKNILIKEKNLNTCVVSFCQAKLIMHVQNRKCQKACWRTMGWKKYIFRMKQKLILAVSLPRRLLPWQPHSMSAPGQQLTASHSFYCYVTALLFGGFYILCFYVMKLARKHIIFTGANWHVTWLYQHFCVVTKTYLGRLYLC